MWNMRLGDDTEPLEEILNDIATYSRWRKLSEYCPITFIQFLNFKFLNTITTIEKIVYLFYVIAIWRS